MKHTVMSACTEGRLSEVDVSFSNKSAATVVMAAAGYPEVLYILYSFTLICIHNMMFCYCTVTALASYTAVCMCAVCMCAHCSVYCA
jgi:phosphoribosylamine-glycine ligase